MKSNRLLAPIGVLVFFLLCLVQSGNAQQACVSVSQPASASWQLGLKCTFAAGASPYGPFPVFGLSYFQIFSVPAGTISAASLSLDSSATGIAASWTTGGILSSGTIGSVAAPVEYANSTATTPTNFGQLTSTITGSGTITIILFGYINNPASTGGGGGGGGGSVTQGTSPWVTQDEATATVGAAVPGTGHVIAGKNGSAQVQDVAVDSNGNIGVNVQNTSATSGATSITSNQCAIVSLSGASQVSIGVTGTWTGTLQPSASVDGSTYNNASVQTSFPIGTAVSTITANGTFDINTLAATSFKVCGNTVATGTAVVTVNASPASGLVVSNLSLVNGTAVATAAAGTMLVGIVGSAGGAFDAANNAAPPANGLVVYGQTQVSGANPASATSGHLTRFMEDLTGNIFVRPGGPNAFSAFITLSSNTTTQIEAAPASGYIAFVTGIVLSTTTAGSATTIALEYGTGTNCATSPTAFTPTYTNTAVGVLSLQFNTPLVIPAAKAICAIQAGTTAGTTSVLLTGYVAP